MDIKPDRFNFYCRTCLAEVNEPKYKLKELPDTLYQLLLQCIDIGIDHQFYPDNICECCYGCIKNFKDLQIQSEKSTVKLKELLKTYCNDSNAENDGIEQSSCGNVKLEDPLNCFDLGIKVEQNSPIVSIEKDFSIEECSENIETEIIQSEEVGDVFFSTSNNDEEIICKFGCGKTFRRISTVRAHYRIKHAKEEIFSEADSHDSNTNIDADWQEAERHNDREKEIVCKVCHRKYADKSTLRVHERLHLDKLPFQCEKCDRSFNKKIRLTKHIAEKHGATPLTLECKYGCGKVFNRYHALENHHSNHRLNKIESFTKSKKSKTKDDSVVQCKVSKPKDAYICEDCGKVLSNAAKFREHSLTHLPAEDRPYKCEYCNRGFIQKRNYKEHLMRHGGQKDFECNMCSYRTSTRRSLVKHRNTHTKELQVTCMICSKDFADPKTLKRHIEVVHQGLKKYNCRYCDKTFAKSDVRNRHEIEHGAERPYKCDLCDESFFLVSKLSSHNKFVHNMTATL